MGDEDSGPLIDGISLSASAVMLAAARRAGDVDLVRGLDGEADLFGFPLDLGAGRRHWFGALPVGDAFLAWSRSDARGNDVDYGPTPSP